MRAIRVLEPNVLSVQDVPQPQRRKGEVRIRIERVGICGSDLAIIQGHNPFAKYPVIPGHEFSGRVVEADPGSGFQVGDLVTARPVLTCGACQACLAGEHNHCPQLKVLGVHQDGAYAEEIVVPQEVVKKAPDGMTPEALALAEPNAVAVHINRRGHVVAGKNVAVIGAGVIGNLAFQVSKARGADKVLAIDRVEQRLTLAQEVGADWAINSATVDPVTFTREHLEDGFDIVFDLVGNESVVDQAIHMARPGGTLVLIAVPYNKMFSFNYQEAFRKELTIVTSRLYEDKDFEESLRLLATSRIRTDRLVTHRLPLAEGVEAIRLVQTQPDVAFKVMLQV